MMTILGIETSTAVCSVGLATEFGVLVERSLVESHIHSEKLLTLVRGVCDERKMALSQLDGIAISIGPGSFTGLRIGLSTAKGLCYALDKPLIAVPAFDAVAVSVSTSYPEYKRVVVCVDAKQGEYYLSAYEMTDGKLNEIIHVQIGNLSAALSAVSGKTIITTDRIDELKNTSSDSCVIKNIFPFCHGDIIARIAIEKLKSGLQNALMNLEPLYLKDFVVRTHVK